MFGLFPKKDDPLTENIDALLNSMAIDGPEGPNYQAHLGYLERLTALKTKTRRLPVSSDQLALIAGNLAAVLIVVAYEQHHVMTSKAKEYLLKPKS